MSTEQNSRIATAPMGRLMVGIGMPIVLSMMLQAAYNIVDSAYLANMREAGEEALTALGLAFPVQLLMVAVAVGTGVGTNALLAKSLGQGDRDKASRTVGNAAVLGIAISIIFLLFGIFGVPAYVNSQNANSSISQTVILMTEDYLRICCCISFGIIFFSIYEKVLQATGRSLYSTIAQITGAVVNIVLDPIMIYGWLGCPEMGVRGAAYATVIGQIVSAAMAFGFHMKSDKEVDNALFYLRPSAITIKEIYAIGLPAIISQALLTVMTYGLNIILARLPHIGENAVTVYGLYCKIQQMIIFAAVGVRDSITPIVSYSYGMGSRKRIREGIRCGMVFTAILMIIGLVLIEAIAIPLTKFFALSDISYTMCVQCIRIVSLAFIAAGVCIAFQGVFQAVGEGIESLLISAGRQVIFILPVAWFLSRYVTGVDNSWIIWCTFLIGECLTLILTLIMYRRTVSKKFDNWKNAA